MRVDITTALACTYDEAVTQVKTTRLFKFAATPLVQCTPVTPPTFPQVWAEGTFRVRLRVLSVVRAYS